MRSALVSLLTACLALAAHAAVAGSVRGVIHDPQHRPVQNAMVMLKAKSSDWSTTANSDANGSFAFNAVPLGEYVVTVAGLGFEQAQQNVVVHLRLAARSPLRAQRRRSQRNRQRLRRPRSRAHRFLPPPPPSSIASKSRALPAPTAPTAWP